MNDRGADGADVILAGVTGSQTSLRAAAYAAGLARRQHARLVLARVTPRPTPVLTDPYAAVAFAAAFAAAPVDSTGWDGIRDVVQLLDVAVELLTSTGNPFQELEQLAGRVRADVVVLGATTSHARRLLGRSIPRRFVQAKRWPVIVVP